MAPPAPIEFAAPRPVSTFPSRRSPKTTSRNRWTIPFLRRFPMRAIRTDSVPPEPATVAEDADAADELDDLHSELHREQGWSRA